MKFLILAILVVSLNSFALENFAENVTGHQTAAANLDGDPQETARQFGSNSSEPCPCKFALASRLYTNSSPLPNVKSSLPSQSER